MKAPAIYLIFGVVLLVLTAATELRGWGASRPSRVSAVPRTVRDNPGSYRPHYVYIGSRYNRGK